MRSTDRDRLIRRTSRVGPCWPTRPAAPSGLITQCNEATGKNESGRGQYPPCPLSYNKFDASSLDYEVATAPFFAHRVPVLPTIIFRTSVCSHTSVNRW